MRYTHTMFSEIYCVVKGRVQGVGYRDFVDTYAKDHGLTGWIKNNHDGSVELVLQGTPDSLKQAVETIQNGSVLAQVESFATDWRTPKKTLDSFAVISS